ncbi:MraY family glycosyltransferase [Flavitalea flava]
MPFHPMFIFVITFMVVCYTIRKVIYISHRKHLFDEPSEDRKIHRTRTPNLGGVAIFAAMAIAIVFFLPENSIGHLNYLIASALILCWLGLTDDLIGVNPLKKFFAQLIVSLIVTLLAGIRLTSFHGFCGWYEMPYAISVLITVAFILLLTNAFNLIDGINCLAGSIGLLSCLCFAIYFRQMQDSGYFFMAVAMCGCLSGFLIYNRTPAKIFMGDTGSLLLGFLIALFAINFIEMNKLGPFRNTALLFPAAPAIVFALLIIPVFDTARAFWLRVLKGRSPFKADRNHIHHLLLELNLSHLQATGILLLVNLSCIALVVLLKSLRLEILFFLILSFMLVMNSILGILVRANKKNISLLSLLEKEKEKEKEFLTLKMFRGGQNVISKKDNLMKT